MNIGTTTRWKRIETLFYRASEIAPEHREAFIEAECADDRALRAELDSLLASSDATLTALAGEVAEAAGGLLSEQKKEITHIGSYRLMHTLGEGGMGTVYLGVRDDDQFHRTVAIKVLRAGLSHRPELQLLFRTERQILADFDHPHIARMLDGGITPQGSPYLVMEYIEGEQLDVYCRAHKLSLVERLQLFRRLCAAVDYAHRHLVIHRDIKPLNVLVTAEGIPKLLDFGIAKLIDPFQSPTEQVLLAGNEQMLTPDYASPEQILGLPISTATDVYALGVLLFELLTGELPFTASPNSRSSEKPSAAALRTHALTSSDARRMRGDLDSILAKAMRREPEQRYASASQLLADLDRYLGGLAVEASEQTIFYRTRKFIWRHRVGAAISALTILMVIGFAMAMAVFARRASTGEAKAQREKDFLAGIFKAATPEGSQGEKITARQLLDRAAGRLDAELGSDAELRADMMENIGQSYVALGLYDQAQPLLAKAESLAAQGLGNGSPVHVEYLSKLGTDIRLEGQYKQAEPIFRRTLDLGQKLYGAQSVEVAHSLSDLGECLYLEDKDQEAEQILRRALAIEQPLSDDQQDGTRSYLALTIERRGAYPEAVRLLRQAANVTAHIAGENSSSYLVDLHNLAGAQIDMGDLQGALASDKEVLARRQKIWGIDHPDTGYSLNNIGWIYLELGQWEKARPYLEQNLAIARKDSNSRFANALANWGRMLELKGDLNEASAQLDEAQLVLSSTGLQKGWTSAKIEVYQSQLALDQRRYTEAIHLASHAAEVETQLGGDSSPQLSSAFVAEGEASLLAGKFDAAEALFRKVLAIRTSLYPQGHREVSIAQVRLAEALLAERKPQEALDILGPTIASSKAAPFPLPTWRLAELQLVDSLARHATGHQDHAEQHAVLSALKDYNQPAIRAYLVKLGKTHEPN